MVGYYENWNIYIYVVNRTNVPMITPHVILQVSIQVIVPGCDNSDFVNSLLRKRILPTATWQGKCPPPPPPPLPHENKTKTHGYQPGYYDIEMGNLYNNSTSEVKSSFETFPEVLPVLKCIYDSLGSCSWSTRGGLTIVPPVVGPERGGDSGKFDKSFFMICTVHLPCPFLSE